jgi:hypothetical protein
MAETTPVVVVIYKRDTKTSETFSGSISAPLAQYAFSEITFNQILERASEALLSAPDHRLVLKREEAPYPMLLPSDIEHLLRTDVPAAIAALTIGPQRVVVGKPKLAVAKGLRHGHDTIADSFGEEIYLRRRPRVVEDPSSGRWVPLLETDGRLQCRTLPLLNVVGDGRWVTARLLDILGLQRPRYYIPRGWNESRGWIAHDSLVTMYEHYLKEKADAANQ